MKKIKKNYNKLIDDFILKNNEIDKISLEKVFKKIKHLKKYYQLHALKLILFL